ncbi:serine hydroxymethyltransferase family protein [Mycobacterium xenopi 3993]|nr:serine hydroxymethyltransferase family protein [Mycobacterium xenopi 3993]
MRSPTRSGHADGRHGPLRRAGGGQGVHRRRGPGAARPRHHHDHAQVAARTTRRADPGAAGLRRRRRPGCPMVLGGPLPHVMAAKAVALAEARRPAFASYAQRVADNAQALAEGFLRRGARLVTGGTDNHIVLLDVTSFGLTGRQAESALLDAGVVTNRNTVPADPNGAWYTSGIRFGTPALTTRGFGPPTSTGSPSW